LGYIPEGVARSGADVARSGKVNVAEIADLVRAALHKKSVREDGVPS
jgi:hypothetical protein